MQIESKLRGYAFNGNCLSSMGPIYASSECCALTFLILLQAPSHSLVWTGNYIYAGNFVRSLPLILAQGEEGVDAELIRAAV